MRIGNTDLNLESLSGMTREEFIEKFSGRLNTDINAAAEKLSSYFKQEEVVEEVILEEVQDDAPKKKRRRR